MPITKATLAWNLIRLSESYGASENTKIKSSTNSAFARSDMIRYNVGVHEYHEGVTSRKVNETKSNTSPRVALDSKIVSLTRISLHVSVHHLRVHL
jgi:hypothetical protein